MTFAVETRGLSRRFGDIIAVSELDLKVPRGSIFGFLGPNGAGKTTTIRMLLGLIRPDQGSVMINGISLAENRCKALSGVGALVESPALYSNLTGKEVLELACVIVKQEKSAIPGLLELLDLSSAADRLVKHYSLGMRQRLALARALVGQPELLILDEPTNGLDPAGIVDMRQLIRQIPERFGATVMLSSHLLTEIEQIADCCAVISEGRMLFQGTLDELKARATPTLMIETPDPEALRRYLRCIGIEAQCHDGQVIASVNPGKEERACLLAELIGKGYSVSALSVKNRNLESLFFELTNKQKSEADHA